MAGEIKPTSAPKSTPTASRPNKTTAPAKPAAPKSASKRPATKESFQPRDSRREKGLAQVGTGGSAMVAGLQQSFAPSAPTSAAPKADAPIAPASAALKADAPSAPASAAPKADAPSPAPEGQPAAKPKTQAEKDQMRAARNRRKEAGRQEKQVRAGELGQDNSRLERQIKRAERAAEKGNPVAKKLLELSKDADHNGKIGPQSFREAKVLLREEKRGNLKDVARGPRGTDGVELGGKGQTWDIKSPISGMKPADGGYSDNHIKKLVDEKLAGNTKVILDKDRLNPGDRAKLDKLVKEMGPQWEGKVRTYTTRPEAAPSPEKANPASAPEKIAPPSTPADAPARPVAAPEALEKAPAAPETPASSRLAALDRGLNRVAVGGGLLQTAAGLQQLSEAQNTGQVVQGATNVGAGTANTGSGLAGLRGAQKLAGRLGAAGAFIDGAGDLYRGVTTGDKEALALGGIKGAAGALMLVPGGQLAGGALLVGTAIYENREWLGRQMGNAWGAVSGWWRGN